jgi:hypothetical protein
LLDATHAELRTEALKMRLIHRHRSHRPKTPQIAITQEEIAADLHYPAARRPGKAARRAALGGRR